MTISTNGTVDCTAAFLRLINSLLIIELFIKNTVEIVYNEHQDQADFARYNRFLL